MKIRRWEPDEIIITDRIRKRIKEDAVLKLMESIQQIGLREPPTIRIKVDSDGCQDAILVAGLHRVEACKRLGLKTIDCVEFEGNETDARLWEIAENLHRAELTVQERAEHVAEWIKLTEKKQAISAQVAPKSKTETNPQGAGRPEGGINAAVRELGIDRTEAQRSAKIARIAPEAKEAAKAAGLANSQTALLNIARKKTVEDQVAAVRREQAEAEQRRQDAEDRRRQKNDQGRRLEKQNVVVLPSTDEQQFAQWLIARMERREMPKIISWLETCNTHDVAAAMRREAA